MALIPMVQQVIGAERHGDRQAQRQAGDDAQHLVRTCSPQHEIVRRLVKEDPERQRRQGADHVGQQDPGPPRQRADELRKPDLQRGHAPDPAGGRRVVADKSANFGMGSHQQAAPGGMGFSIAGRARHLGNSTGFDGMEHGDPPLTGPRDAG